MKSQSGQFQQVVLMTINSLKQSTASQPLSKSLSQICDHLK